MKESFPLIKQNCMQIHSFRQLPNCGTHYLKLYKQILQLARWKKYLSTNDTMIPIYYYFGTRKEQVKHCRLRLAISDLNYDLFRRHLLEDPMCSCGYTAETSEHFLLHCPLYNSIRNKTINKLDENKRNINTLLFGNDQLHLETNKNIFAIVHDFLRQTDRL